MFVKMFIWIFKRKKRIFKGKEESIDFCKWNDCIRIIFKEIRKIKRLYMNLVK